MTYSMWCEIWFITFQLDQISSIFRNMGQNMNVMLYTKRSSVYSSVWIHSFILKSGIHYILNDK